MVNTKAHDALTATAREATLRALRDEMERRGLVRVHRGRDGRPLGVELTAKGRAAAEREDIQPELFREPF